VSGRLARAAPVGHLRQNTLEFPLGAIFKSACSTACLQDENLCNSNCKGNQTCLVNCRLGRRRGLREAAGPAEEAKEDGREREKERRADGLRIAHAEWIRTADLLP
jgi:hypothetical protein